MPGTAEEGSATVFGAVNYEVLEKVRQIIHLHKKRRRLLSQKELVGRIVEENVGRYLEEARQQSQSH